MKTIALGIWLLLINLLPSALSLLVPIQETASENDDLDRVCASCKLVLDQVPDNLSPLILDAKGEWMIPKKDNNIYVPNGSNVTFYCPNTSFNYLAVNKLALNGGISLTCDNCYLKTRGVSFYYYSNFACKADLNLTLSRFSEDRQAGLTVYKIGYRSGPVILADDVTAIYQIAFHNSPPFTAIFTRHIYSSSTPPYSGSGTTTWEIGDFYQPWTQTNLATAYMRATEQTAFLNQGFSLESLTSIFNYWNNNGGVSTTLFQKGHLTPNADFGQGAQRSATYFYPNAAPQWGPFNEQNWKQLEASIRYFVDNLGWGRINGNAVEVEIFTGVSSNTNGSFDGQLRYTTPNVPGGFDVYILSEPAIIPIPRFFWKIVNTFTQSVAFIGLNIPGTLNANLLWAFQYQACQVPIRDIFYPPANLNTYYIRARANRNGYGNIFACELKNVLLPEMLYVIDKYSIPEMLLTAPNLP